MSKLGYFLGGAVAGALGLAALACVIDTSPAPSASSLGHNPDADEFAAAKANDDATGAEPGVDGNAEANIFSNIAELGAACTGHRG